MKTQQFIDKWTDHPGQNKAIARDIEALVADRTKCLEGIADLQAEETRLREVLFKATKDLMRIIKGWRDYAAGDYCQTYNSERGKGLEMAADDLENYVYDAYGRNDD